MEADHRAKFWLQGVLSVYLTAADVCSCTVSDIIQTTAAHTCSKMPPLR